MCFSSGSKSRLIREDDNDGSDEDEIITMSGIVSFAADREKRKEGLDTFITTGIQFDILGASVFNFFYLMAFY